MLKGRTHWKKDRFRKEIKVAKEQGRNVIREDSLETGQIQERK